MFGAIVERVLIRPVENAPPLNPVILTLGLYTLLVAIAGMIWGNTPRSFPAAFSLRGYTVGGTTLLFTPNDTFIVLIVIAVAAGLALFFRATTLGLQMRASAFAPEVAKLLGVRVGRMFTLGWALASLVGSLAGVLVAPSTFLGPNSFDPILISGFVAAVLGGLDSPPGAVIGGLILGLALSYVSGYEGSALVPLAALVILCRRPDDPAERAVLDDAGAAGMSFARVRGVFAAHTILRSLLIVALAGLALWIISVQISAYNDLQLATGAYYFAALAGLTVLAGLSGQISLGHGALMAIGAYTVALLIGNEGWAVIPALVASAVVTGLVGIPVGAAASRLRGPYLAGATLAFAVGLPALADKFPKTFGGENGLSINPSVPPAVARRELPARALGGMDRVRRGPGRAVRALQRDPQRHRALAAGRPRRRDRRVAERAARGAHPDVSRSRSAPPAPGSAAAC